MASSPNHIATISRRSACNDKTPADKQRGRRPCDDTRFECVALAGFYSCPERQFRRVNNRGCGPLTALDSNVFRSGRQHLATWYLADNRGRRITEATWYLAPLDSNLRPTDNRGDTGNVVPGSIFSPSLVFSGLEGAIPPGG